MATCRRLGDCETRRGRGDSEAWRVGEGVLVACRLGAKVEGDGEVGLQTLPAVHSDTAFSSATLEGGCELVRGICEHGD